MPFAAFEVSTRIADVDQAVPGNRSGWRRLAMFRVPYRRLPELFACLEIKGQHSCVLGAAEQHAVHVGGASVGGQQAAKAVEVRAPFFGASSGVKGENVELGGPDQGPLDHDQRGLEGGELMGVVRAQNLQLPDVLGGDLVQRRETLRRRCSVVARPIAGRRVRPCSHRLEEARMQRRRLGRRDLLPCSPCRRASTGF